MQQQHAVEEETSCQAVAVLPTATLLSALQVMERHHVRLLPVMDETGRLLGLISEAHILAAWGEDPLLPVSRVMEACGAGEEPRPVRVIRATDLLEGMLDGARMS
ncbi:CBS domain-containing protein [Stigmatella sp. ncwal1]|uniref:CBS domain-containing protein n=1 Tax=Stigmatella ashevillensis TaxID=2995309 RepID=A0ABT5DDR1_9BACT|nr:CBS domain-containing protein [Stigmatella ashevillena]MDC0711238.1 CBS domain-containing protein [Stigmatella ashevillena]